MAKVKFQQIGSDMFWDFYTPKGQHLQWVGYNDSYWWKEVSTQKGFNQQTDENGVVWQIDFVNNECIRISGETEYEMYKRQSEEIESRKIGRKDGWVSVKDQMPTNTKEVLVSGVSKLFGFRVMSLAIWMDDFWKILRNDLDPYDTLIIDFWQPLPLPPNTDEK